MNGEMIGGLVRHILTTFGGLVVGQGYMSGDEYTAAVGAVATLIGLGWSLFKKRRA